MINPPFIINEEPFVQTTICKRHKWHDYHAEVTSVMVAGSICAYVPVLAVEVCVVCKRIRNIRRG